MPLLVIESACAIAFHPIARTITRFWILPMDTQSEISEKFAQELLRALYGLDAHVGRLDKICSALPSGALKTECIDALGRLMQDVLSKLMVPIYRQRPTLGSANEPGSWMEQKRK